MRYYQKLATLDYSGSLTPPPLPPPPRTAYKTIADGAAFMFGAAGRIFGSPDSSETRTVYTTRRTIAGHRTTAKEELTTTAVFRLLIAAVFFLLSVGLIAFAGVVFLVEAPLRMLTGQGQADVAQRRR